MQTRVIKGSWARATNIILGLWLMVAPGIFGWSKTAADNDHIIGPVIITISFTALWEATRGMRKWNLPLGAWLLLAPWVLGYDNTGPIINDMVVGALVIFTSRIKGKVTNSFGGGWEAIWKSDAPHLREAQKQQNNR